MAGSRDVQRFRYMLFFLDHADQNYTVEQIMKQCDVDSSCVEEILEELCRLEIIERLQHGKAAAYRYRMPVKLTVPIMNERMEGREHT